MTTMKIVKEQWSMSSFFSRSSIKMYHIKMLKKLIRIDFSQWTMQTITNFMYKDIKIGKYCCRNMEHFPRVAQTVL